MKLVRSVVTCVIRSVCATSPSMHLLVGDDPRQAHGVDRHLAPAASASAAPCALRCPTARRAWPGGGTRRSRRACMWRRPRRRSASSAPRRSRSSAPRSTLPGPPATASRRSSTAKPVVPITTWTPAARRLARVGDRLVGLGEVDEDVGVGEHVGHGVPSAGSARPPSSRSSAASTAAQTVWPIRPAAPATATESAQRRPPRRRAGRARRGRPPRRARSRPPTAAPVPTAPARARARSSQRHGVDAGHELVRLEQRQPDSVGAAEPVHARAGGLQREDDAGLDVLVARSSSSSVAGSARIRSISCSTISIASAEVVGPRADVQADLPRVLVLPGERVDAVGQAALLADRLEQPRRADSPPKIASSTRAAKRRSSSRGSPTPPRQTWTCSVSLRRKRTVGGRAGGAPPAPGARSSRLEAAEGALGELDDRVVVDGAGGRDTTFSGRSAARGTRGSRRPAFRRSPARGR